MQDLAVEALAELFETNRIIVLTVYGQVFFVLGLAIALQSLKRSTLALARPLPWLAPIGHAVLWVVMLAAVVSAVDYYRRFQRLLNARVADVNIARQRKAG